MLNAAMLLCLTAGPLDRAFEAFRAGQYQQVPPLVDEALADPALPAADQARAHGLAALIHSAFDHPTEAIASYEKALDADSTFDVKDASPKVRALFDEAKKNHVRKTRPPPEWVQAPPPAPPPPPAEPWFKNPWVWGVAGVLVAGAAVTTTVLVLEARMPVGNLPNGQLR